MTETIEESAARIWSMARDLASPNVSGSSLNSERGTRHIASLLNAYAAMHAETSVLAMEVLERAKLMEQVKTLKAELKEIRAHAEVSKT